MGYWPCLFDIMSSWKQNNGMVKIFNLFWIISIDDS